MEKFESEIFDIITRFAWGFEKSPSTIKLVGPLVKKLSRHPHVKNDKHKLTTLHSLLHSYSFNRKRLLNNLISLKTPPNLEDGKVFRSHFKLHSQQIVIAADKNIGFVCMDKSDYLLQYEKINLQQHFGQVNLSESAYITFILDFLSQASTHIPYELSLLV